MKDWKDEEYTRFQNVKISSGEGGRGEGNRKLKCESEEKRRQHYALVGKMME